MWETKVNYEARRMKKKYQDVVSDLTRYQNTINQQMNTYVYNNSYGAKKIASSNDIGGAYATRYRNKENDWNQTFSSAKSEIETFLTNLSTKIQQAQSKVELYAAEEYYKVWKEDKDDKN